MAGARGGCAERQPSSGGTNGSNKRAGPPWGGGEGSISQEAESAAALKPADESGWSNAPEGPKVTKRRRRGPELAANGASGDGKGMRDAIMHHRLQRMPGGLPGELGGSTALTGGGKGNQVLGNGSERGKVGAGLEMLCAVSAPGCQMSAPWCCGA